MYFIVLGNETQQATSQLCLCRGMIRFMYFTAAQFTWSHTGVIKTWLKKVNTWTWEKVSVLCYLSILRILQLHLKTNSFAPYLSPKSFVWFGWTPQGVFGLKLVITTVMTSFPLCLPVKWHFQPMFFYLELIATQFLI